MNAFAGIRPKGVKTRPPSFIPWRLHWGLSVFQWGSNPQNPPPPPIFTLVLCYLRDIICSAITDISEVNEVYSN